jgi:magnesium transporter
VLKLYPPWLHEETGADAVAGAVWIDMINPTEEEAALVSAAIGVATPSRAALSEIESSSRLQVDGEMLRLSAPLLAHADTPAQSLTPVGFVLTPQRLVTIRFTKLRVFDLTWTRCEETGSRTSVNIFSQLIEAIVDREADLLEHIAQELEQISRALFRPEEPGRKGTPSDDSLKQTLRDVGQIGDRLSEIRASLLGVHRIAAYTREMGSDWLGQEHVMRLNAARQDIASLDDFEEHLATKTQFLLDAVLGFINTQQNELFKVLTIVSVVGVPPTLVASVYGMNFRYMPELEWRTGYPLALFLIVASAVVPVLWFKWKKWW